MQIERAKSRYLELVLLCLHHFDRCAHLPGQNTGARERNAAPGGRRRQQSVQPVFLQAIVIELPRDDARSGRGLTKGRQIIRGPEDRQFVRKPIRAWKAENFLRVTRHTVTPALGRTVNCWHRCATARSLESALALPIPVIAWEKMREPWLSPTQCGRQGGCRRFTTSTGPNIMRGSVGTDTVFATFQTQSPSSLAGLSVTSLARLT